MPWANINLNHQRTMEPDRANREAYGGSCFSWSWGWGTRSTPAFTYAQDLPARASEIACPPKHRLDLLLLPAWRMRFREQVASDERKTMFPLLRPINHTCVYTRARALVWRTRKLNYRFTYTTRFTRCGVFATPKKHNTRRSRAALHDRQQQQKTVTYTHPRTRTHKNGLDPVLHTHSVDSNDLTGVCKNKKGHRRPRAAVLLST